jgi:hypothetical protein
LLMQSHSLYARIILTAALMHVIALIRRRLAFK